MAWTNISNALVAVGAKPFATTIQAIRDNIVALAAGDPGAPKVSGPAMGAFLGFYSMPMAGLTIAGLDRMKVLRFDAVGSFGNQTPNRVLRVQFSSDGGATFGASQDLLSFNTGPSITRSDAFCMVFDLVTGAFFAGGSGALSGGSLTPVTTVGSATLSVPTNCNAMRFTWSSASATVLNLTGTCLQGAA